MRSIELRTGRSTGRPPLLSVQTIMQIRWWSTRQRYIAAVVFVLAFVVIGEVGETLPPANTGRMYPVEWWNWVTLAVSAALIGLIAAGSLPRSGQPAGSAPSN